MDLLVFKPSTSDVKASQIGRVPSMEERGENPTQKDTLKHDIVTGMGSLSLALSLGKVLFVWSIFRFMYIQNLKKKEHISLKFLYILKFVKLPAHVAYVITSLF